MALAAVVAEAASYQEKAAAHRVPVAGKTKSRTRYALLRSSRY